MELPACLRPPVVTEECFDLNGWFFVCRTGPIWGHREFAASNGKLQQDATPVDRCPDAFFGHNCLQIHFINPDAQAAESGGSGASKCCLGGSCKGCAWGIDISPIDAVNGTRIENWDKSTCFPNSDDFVPSMLKVREAEVWNSQMLDVKNKLAGNFETIASRYDWTCSSKYCGSVKFHNKRCLTTNSENLNVSPSPNSSIDSLDNNAPGPIPMSLLADRSIPILWFKQCDLFSDDLSDSGFNSTDVKIRVMPSFWFVLYRQSIRVDNVALRMIDVRLFHRFGTDTVVRECVWKEARYGPLRERMVLSASPPAEDSGLPPVPQFVLLNDGDIVFRVVETFHIK